MYRLECPTQGYDWGSTNAIQNFVNLPADGSPVAEVWMGTHRLGMSQVRDDQSSKPLSDVAGDLPFMLKILAAARPLSIQTHPSPKLAVEGFAAEEAAGIPIDAPHRVFKDDRPKPEMIYALSTFDSLVGFRPTAEILRVLAQLDHPVTRRLSVELRSNPGFAGIVEMLAGMLAAPPTADEIAEVVDLCKTALDHGIDVKRAYETAVHVAEFYPGDVGILVSLLLNRLTLQPGEAAYLSSGIIHAHLQGLGLEVMVSSDNVLRAGLTTKHVDPQGLVACLEEGMSRVARVTPQLFGQSTDVFSPSDEFALSITQTSPAEPRGCELPEAGHRLLVCTGGEVALTNADRERLWLKRGEIIYAGPKDGALRAYGTGEVAQAFAPPLQQRNRLIDLV